MHKWYLNTVIDNIALDIFGLRADVVKTIYQLGLGVIFKEKDNLDQLSILVNYKGNYCYGLYIFIVQIITVSV